MFNLPRLGYDPETMRAVAVVNRRDGKLVGLTSLRKTTTAARRGCRPVATRWLLELR